MFDLKRDIEKGLKTCHELSLHSKNGINVVKGSFTAHNKKNKIEIETYDVLIGFPKNYPFRFPLVVEVSNKIPKEVDRHVKPNGTLCFSNPQDELAVCKGGITFTWFLEEILNPHLCREFVREKTKKYPTGERSHGNEGVWEGYYDVFNTNDKILVLRQLELVLTHSPIGRNAPCYCGSEKKYKTCHEQLEHQVLIIGKANATALYEFLKHDFDKQ